MLTEHEAEKEFNAGITPRMSPYPSRILSGHLSDQQPEVLGQARPSRWSGLPAPEQSKSLTVIVGIRIGTGMPDKSDVPRQQNWTALPRPSWNVARSSFGRIRANLN